jgi:hypothetical protein
MVKLICIVLLISIPSLVAQDFFDEAPDDATSKVNLSYELNGFSRGVFLGGKVAEKDDAELKAGYGELGLKFRARKGKYGDGFAEIRFRRGSEFDQPISEVNLREAYVNTYLGDFDLRLGHQIVVWGRADGFNPTNNITPQNMIARSTDEDDRKEGNFLLRSFYYWHPLRFELIWVPQYISSVLPTGLFPFPEYVKLGEAVVPDAKLKNSSVAVKLDVESGLLGGSLSYFRGFMPLPGVFLSNLEINEKGQLLAVVRPRSYKMDVIGADFSTTFSSFGLRGEFAYRTPVDDYETDEAIHIPNPDFQYVLGMDKSKGDFSIILQYIGRYVVDFKEYESTGSPLDELEQKNRMIASQLDETSHAVFMRPSLTLLHETLDLELLAYYNVTTEESLLRPVISYDLADALAFKIGAEWYVGPDNTLFGNIDEALSSIFLELKASF